MKKITLFLFLISFICGYSQTTTFTVEVPPGTDGVRMTGPWWGWNPLGGPIAVDNGNNTFTVTLFDGAAQAEMEYLWVITNADGSATAGTGQEVLWDNAANGECTDRINAGTLITDYANWGNRVYLVGPTSLNEVYDSCAESTLSIPSDSVLNIGIYPNPSLTGWNVRYNNFEESEIQLFDVLGNKVLNILPNSSEFFIDASELISGIYFARIISPNGSISKKLIKA